MDVDRLQEGLCTKRFGKRIVFLQEIDSTNNYAKKLASYGAEEGTVVIAETQTAGRGRLGREWISPMGGLYLSIILRPKIRAVEAVKLVFVASLAVAKVLNEIYRLSVETKWPNDVLVKGKKVCGILAESNTAGEKVNYTVIGLGVNANFSVEKTLPKELAETATSLENELGRKILFEELFRELIEKLETVYYLFLKEGFAPILDEWKKYACFLGQKVEVASGAEKLHGIAVDIDSDGSLILKQNDSSIKLVSGDLSLN
ncbi:biotin--[acetyl-CoA-carboxylase] ligase [Candidatus Bathyarchaeota archaeon]|nr:biotin--[acetyl-CoA-carboxylase] ligase [Candidatus Bathyarchaeota archaeon]